MIKKNILIYSIFMGVMMSKIIYGAQSFQTDTIPTSEGNLVIHFIGHASLIFEFKGKMIHIDPFSRMADYGELPKADLILITHEHGDHLDPGAIEKIKKEDTIIVLTKICAERLGEGIVMKNGDTRKILGLTIEAVPAYNIINHRENGQPFHPPGNGNGYVLTFGNRRVYIAGDTENIPEMKALKSIDVAFLPMNLPYTMSPAMTAAAAKSFKPAILYPYHYGKTNTNELLDLLKNEKDIEVRIR